MIIVAMITFGAFCLLNYFDTSGIWQLSSTEWDQEEGQYNLSNFMLSHQITQYSDNSKPGK